MQNSNMKRLVRDVNDIMKNPLHDNGIYYIHDETDMLSGTALIIGPENTPYFGGYYFFSFKFTTQYPYMPPIVTYCTNGEKIRFNPNLYTNGKVCISILNTWSGEQWSACESIRSVLLHLCGLLVTDPLLNEPNITSKHRDFFPYNYLIEYKNIDIAICGLLQKDPNYYLPFFDKYYEIMVEHFNRNASKLFELVEKLNQENTDIRVIHINLYRIATGLNYGLLKDKFISCANNFGISLEPNILRK
jgi:ubiquitin-protein ligase